MYPDFLIIGAQKAGTTWLHHNLLQHPGIWMPKEKELHYFDEKIGHDFSLRSKLFGNSRWERRWRRQVKRQLKSYKKNGVSVQDLKWDLNYFMRRPGDRWYASLFEQGKDKLTGETTPDYSVLERETISHVYSLMPQAKIILIMRNPIERIWSRLVMVANLHGHKEVEKLSEDYLRQQLETSYSQSMTDYLKILARWSEFYPQEQIFIGFTEDISFYPGRFVKMVHNFLGTDPDEARRLIMRKIHTSQQDTIPTWIAYRIAGFYRENIEELSERFGSYASFWLYCAKRLGDEPQQAETVTYPLFGSQLWQEWRDGEGNTLANKPQSGPLSSMQLSL